MPKIPMIFPAVLAGSKKPWSISLPGTGTSGIDLGTETTIDDLQDNAFTVEAWIKQAATQPDVTVAFFDKGHFNGGVGWLYYFSSTGGVNTLINCATADATANTGVGNKILDDAWHHVAICFDDAGDRKSYIAIDGIWVSANQVAGDGAIVSDAAQTLKMATRNASPEWRYKGNFGWIRISNNIRYSRAANFTPAARSAPPADDANTVRLFKVNEGSGATLTDSSSNAQNATVTSGTWVQG